MGRNCKKDKARRFRRHHHVTSMFHVVRAVWSNKIGPRPVRSRDFPHGFPWLKGELKEKAAIGSKLVLRCVEVLDIAPPYTVCVWEHPEDLGVQGTACPLASGSWRKSDGQQRSDVWKLSHSISAHTVQTIQSPQGC